VLATSPYLTSSVHIRGCSIVRRQEDGLSRLIYLCSYPEQSIICPQQRMRMTWTALDMIWWPDVVLAASPNWTYTRLWCFSNMCRWSEPVDLRLLLSRTKYNWSLAPDEDDMDSATYDMVARCGAGGQPERDNVSTETSL
jgi:hypothetical protein